MTATAPYTSIERTLSVLLSPLDHPTWQSWQRAAHAELVELTNADSLCIYTPLTHGADAWYAPHVNEASLAAYATQVSEDPTWDVIETGFSAFAAKTGRAVAHESEFVTARTRKTSAFYREFLVPNALHDLTVAGVGFGGLGASRLHFANRKPRSQAEHVERAQLVKTVLPALKSGLAMWRQLGQRRSELAYVFDALTDSILLFDAAGSMVHANTSALQLMSPTSGATIFDIERLRNEATLAATRLNALMRHSGVGAPTITPSAVTRDVQTQAGTITVRAALAPSWMFGREHGVLVTLEKQVARALSDTEIRSRFGLTSRELEVARGVAEGLSNQALAERFGVSFFTARNHVERVLTKMSAHSRAQVGAILRATAQNEIAA